MLPQKEIENRIYTIRGAPVMIDRDLAELYGIETKVLNQSVKRNIERFPESFRFQISEYDLNELNFNKEQPNRLRSQFVTSSRSWWKAVPAICIYRTKRSNALCRFT